MHIQPRRSFLKLALAAGAAPLFASVAGRAQADAGRTFAPRASDWQRYETVTKIALPAGQGPAQIWLPVPSLENDYQRSIDDAVSGNATSAEFVTDKASGARYLHARFDGNAAPTLALTSTFQTRNRTIDWQAKGTVTEDPAVLQAALRPSASKPLDGVVGETARKITAGATTDVEKIRAIYAWMVDHCYRNLDTPGCGPGDTVATLTSNDLGGKCADLNGLFVALARASDVPARDVYGIRVAPSAFGYKQLGANSESVTGAQHCRSEVFLSGYGWVAMDPADVLKVMRAESDRWIKDPKDPLVTQVNDALFGNWEGNWVAYNTAEDVALAGSARTLPFLMYPQGEVAGRAIDELDAKDFTYTITARAV